MDRLTQTALQQRHEFLAKVGLARQDRHDLIRPPTADIYTPVLRPSADQCVKLRQIAIVHLCQIRLYFRDVNMC